MRDDGAVRTYGQYCPLAKSAEILGDRWTLLILRELLEPGDASVCLQDPGFEVDLLVTAELSSPYEDWYGRLDLSRARRDGRVGIRGPRALQRSFPGWFTLSPLAGAVRAAHTPKVSAG